MRILGPFLFALAMTGQSPAAGACTRGQACEVAGGQYIAIAPQGWDHVRQLPVLVHFHGFRESAGDMAAREDLRSFANRRGALLVFPGGAGNTWSHPGSPAQNRDEFRFVAAVMTDVERRYPLDRSRVIASGFSQGAAMVWNLACRATYPFTGYLAIAGTFWRPQPENCAAGAQNVIQIHGVADRTVPLEGRAIRNGAFHQGDVFRAMAMMRVANACTAPTRAERDGALVCEVMERCASGRRLELCLHPNGHDFDPVWLDHAWRAFTASDG